MFNNNIERRELIGAIGTAAAIGLSGCAGSGGGSGPRATTEAYLNAYFGGNYEEARSYTTGQLRETIQRDNVVASEEANAEVDEYVSTEELEQQAAVTYVMTAETALGATAETQTALLIKEEGEWKVTYIADTEDVSASEASSYTN